MLQLSPLGWFSVPLRLGSVLELNAPSEMNAPSIMKVFGRFWTIVKACYKKQFGGLTTFVSCFMIGSMDRGESWDSNGVTISCLTLRKRGKILFQSPEFYDFAEYFCV